MGLQGVTEHMNIYIAALMGLQQKESWVLPKNPINRSF